MCTGDMIIVPVSLIAAAIGWGMAFGVEWLLA
jgi:hypothetical protein